MTIVWTTGPNEDIAGIPDAPTWSPADYTRAEWDAELTDFAFQMADRARDEREHRGFGLLETLVAMAISAVVVGALVGLLVTVSKLTTTLATASFDLSQGRSRIARQVADLTAPVAGVIVTPDALLPCLYHVKTQLPDGRWIQEDASRGC